MKKEDQELANEDLNEQSFIVDDDDKIWKYTVNAPVLIDGHYVYSITGIDGGGQ